MAQVQWHSLGGIDNFSTSPRKQRAGCVVTRRATVEIIYLQALSFSLRSPTGAEDRPLSFAWACPRLAVRELAERERRVKIRSARRAKNATLHLLSCHLCGCRFHFASRQSGRPGYHHTACIYRVGAEWGWVQSVVDNRLRIDLPREAKGAGILRLSA